MERAASNIRLTDLGDQGAYGVGVLAPGEKKKNKTCHSIGHGRGRGGTQ